MTEKQKILKIKVGEAFVDGKPINVYQTAFKKTSKKGNTYYEARQQIFVNEIEVKTQETENKEA